MEESNFFKCLCRKYKDEDLNNFKNYPITSSKTNYILALKNKSRTLEDNIFLKNYDDFFKENNLLKITGGIIISGSFPTSIDLKYQQNIIDALYAIVVGILKRGGKIIFGSHPTFQGVILEIAKSFNTDFEKKVKLYVSKQFEGSYDIKYFKENSDLFEIERDSSNKIDASLTKMRKSMISDKEAIAMICIGGKDNTSSLTIKPGLDEEIELAKNKNLKVFVLGSTGGRSKQLVTEGFVNPIEDKSKRKDVSFGNNFKSILDIILNEIGE
ncbi:MAG: hypothetical protein ACRC0V_10620 [Fusobacteriaceae bacterium]